MKGLPDFFRGATALGVAAAAALVTLSPAQAEDAAAKPIKIVAIGSSSTAGAGASSPSMSYPGRLQVELQALMPRVTVTVVNRGANGEEAREMLARFER